MSVPIDPARRGTPRRATSCGSEQTGSAASPRLDMRQYAYPPTHGWREPMIRRAAYLRALNRGFQPGKELEDWLAAEREVEDLVACGAAPYQC
jgi:hypothetical protein